MHTVKPFAAELLRRFPVFPAPRAPKVSESGAAPSVGFIYTQCAALTISRKRSTRRSCNRAIPGTCQCSAYRVKEKIPGFLAGMFFLAARKVCKRQTERRPEGEISE